MKWEKQSIQLSKQAHGIYVRSWVELGLRILFAIFFTVYIYAWKKPIEALEGLHFFNRFTIFHLVWCLWLWYMISKLFPLFTSLKAPGSTKYLKSQFIPTEGYLQYTEAKKAYPKALSEGELAKLDEKERKRYDSMMVFETIFEKEKKANQKGVLATILSWTALSAAIFLAHMFIKLVDNRMLFIFSCLFYIFDLICIMLWCPFRNWIVKTRCCTQCRIYNWDTFMLMTPMLFVPGFFSYSLGLFSIADVTLWEVTAHRHPERYCACSNKKLQCATCKGALGCANLRP